MEAVPMIIAFLSMLGLVITLEFAERKVRESRRQCNILEAEMRYIDHGC